MAWAILLVAGILEVVWAYSMKLSDGFSRLGPSAVTFVAMFLSFGLLAVAMKSLPLGTAYTVWTGIGAVGAFVVGIVVLGEAVTVTRWGPSARPDNVMCASPASSGTVGAPETAASSAHERPMSAIASKSSSKDATTNTSAPSA